MLRLTDTLKSDDLSLDTAMVYKMFVSLFLICLAAGTSRADDLCVDAIPDCRSYGDDTCVNYADWAKINCAYTCHFCTGTAPPKECKDQVPNCDNYAAEMCTSSGYRIWAEDHCPFYCGFCGTSNSTVATSTSNSTVATSTSNSTVATTTALPEVTTTNDPGIHITNSNETTTTASPKITTTNNPGIPPTCVDVINFCTVYSPLACNRTDWANSYCKNIVIFARICLLYLSHKYICRCYFSGMCT